MFNSLYIPGGSLLTPAFLTRIFPTLDITRQSWLLAQPLEAQVAWQMVVEIVSQQLENNSLGSVCCNIEAIYNFQSGF